MSAPAVGRRSYRSLDLAFTIDAPGGFAALVDTVFSSCREANGRAAASRSVHYDVTVGSDGTITLARDGEVLETDPHTDYALDYLVWDVNQQVVAASGRRLLLHCGAVARDEHAVLVAAPSGGGKSTLTAALVRAGYAYGTDELVAVGRDGDVDPHPKAIGLKQGSWALLDDLLPAPPAGLLDTSTRYVAPVAVAGAPLTPAVVVVRDDGDGAEPLAPISRAEAVVVLAGLAFNFVDAGPDRLPALAALVQRAQCYRLATRDLDRAVEVVGAALDAVRA